MRILGPISAFAVIAASAATAGKPPTPSPSANTQLAYEVLSGKSNKLILSNEDGTNASTIYTAQRPFRFDLSPRGVNKIAVSQDSADDPAIWLVSLTTSGSGLPIASGSPVRLRDARDSTHVDFSPDGSKLLFACCSNGTTEKLVVYELATGASTEWATVSYAWDLAFFRNGNSIAFSAWDGSGAYALFEVTGPGAEPRRLLTNRSDIYFDASRANSDALVVNYHDAVGHALTGLWQAPTADDPAGHFLVQNLASSIDSFFGAASCEDRKLAYLGPPNQSPSWYIRVLSTGITRTFSKTYDRWVQFWPDSICP